MAWIESHQSIQNHGKIIDFANALGINRYQAIGHIHAFWWWAIDSAGESGDISRYSAKTIAEACGWSAYCRDEFYDQSKPMDWPNPEEEAFFRALVISGLVDWQGSPEKFDLDDPVNHQARIHDWDKFTWRYFAAIRSTENKRFSGLERQRKFRNKHVTGACNVTPSVTVTEACNVTSREQPNLTNLTTTSINVLDVKKKESTAPFSSLFCEYNDMGQGSCTVRKADESRFCQEHKLKVRDKFLMKQEKNPLNLPPPRSFS